MSGKRYTKQFKVEAVKQVTERGRPVAEVAERLGVTNVGNMLFFSYLCASL